MNNSKSLQWVKRDEKVIAPCQHLSNFPLVVEEGKGEIITDIDGNNYIDFLSSASSLNLGSNHPILIEAIKTQLNKCTQYCAGYTYNRPMIEYAERLTSVYPGGVDAKICFGNCGSDSNDAAIKFSRAYTGRKKVISFVNSYHGNTYGASSLSACTTRMREKIGPFLPEIYHFNFVCENDDETDTFFENLHNAFNTYIPPSEVAAVIIEPMQGDAGFKMASYTFMRKLYRTCKKHGILFICDEVQQGLFRNNYWFSIENFDIIPDGIIMGKSLGAGLTLGAFMAKSEIMDSLPAPAHSFTLAGNHLACAAGIAEFDYLSSTPFQNILKANTKLLKEEVYSLLRNKTHHILGNAWGSGMSYGISIINPSSHKPDINATFKIIYRCYEYGLLIISLAGNILRIQPPLNISEINLKRGFEILKQSIHDVETNRVPNEVLKYKRGW